MIIDVENRNIYLFEIELSLMDFTIILLNIVGFLILIISWKIISKREKKNKNLKSIPLGQFTCLGDGGTSKFFTPKLISNQNVPSKKKIPNKNLPYQNKPTTKRNQVEEIICNCCKRSFSVCYQYS
jgi:hypothetical protein